MKLKSIFSTALVVLGLALVALPFMSDADYMAPTSTFNNVQANGAVGSCFGYSCTHRNDVVGSCFGYSCTHRPR